VQNQPGCFVTRIIGAVAKAESRLFESAGDPFNTFSYSHGTKYNGNLRRLNSKITHRATAWD
jgi:hypothetical protein